MANLFLLLITSFLSATGDTGDLDFSDLSGAITELLDKMLSPCLVVATSLAVVWGLYLGIKFWMAAGDEQKKKSAKSSIISFVVGIVVIFAVAVGAPLLIGALSTWAQLG